VEEAVSLAAEVAGLERKTDMKKMLVVASFVAVAVSSPANALQHQITPLQPTDLTCSNLKGTWQYNANWEPLFDATKPPDPVTRKRPFLIDPKTGKPWPTYQVRLTLAPGSAKGSGPCTVPNGGAVNCGGATKCSILVTCPVTASGAYVAVQGTGVANTAVRTVAGRKPANCS
jgi:hypothetical protein